MIAVRCMLCKHSFTRFNPGPPRCCPRCYAGSVWIATVHAEGIHKYMAPMALDNKSRAAGEHLEDLGAPL